MYTYILTQSFIISNAKYWQQIRFKPIEHCIVPSIRIVHCNQFCCKITPVTERISIALIVEDYRYSEEKLNVWFCSSFWYFRCIGICSTCMAIDGDTIISVGAKMFLVIKCNDLYITRIRFGRTFHAVLAFPDWHHVIFVRKVLALPTRSFYILLVYVKHVNR